MGIYLDGAEFDYPLRTEYRRQAAVDQGKPRRHHGNPKLGRIVQEAAVAYSTVGAAVTILDRDQQIFLSRVGTEVWQTLRDESLCDLTIQRVGETTIIYDADRDPRTVGRLRSQDLPSIRFYAGNAIVDQNGYPLGALCVFDTEPRTHAQDMTRLASLTREVERIVCH